MRGRGEVSGEGMPAERVGGEGEAAARERALAAAVAAASGGGMGIAGGRGVGVRKEVRETVGPGAGTRIVAAEAVAVAVPLLVAVVVGRRRRSRGPADPWCDVVKGFQKHCKAPSLADSMLRVSSSSSSQLIWGFGSLYPKFGDLGLVTCNFFLPSSSV